MELVARQNKNDQHMCHTKLLVQEPIIQLSFPMTVLSGNLRLNAPLVVRL